MEPLPIPEKTFTLEEVCLPFFRRQSISNV